MYGRIARGRCVPEGKEMAQLTENKVAGGKRVDCVLPFFCSVIEFYRTANFKPDSETGGR